MMLGFPLPYHQELLYSVIARHGVHSGIVSPKELLREVFGETKILATSDLPSHLKRIAALYPESLGIAPIELLYQNTLFALYAPFIGEVRRNELVRQLTANGKSAVHLTAGVAASRVKQPTYLRYCPGCIREQKAAYGEYFWRRDWQVAGADNCPVHGHLVDSTIRRHDMHRHQFHAADTNVCPLTTQQAGNWQSDLIAKNTSKLLNLGPQSVPELFQWSLWYQNLAVDNQLSRGSQVRHDLVCERVVGFWGAGWLTRQGLLPECNDTNWLRNIFRKHRKAFSYLEHLTVLHAFLKLEWCFSEVMRTAKQLDTKMQAPLPVLKVGDKQEVEDYRLKWLAAVKKYGTKLARLNGFGAMYAWLYRHDRSWLVAINQRYKLPEVKHQAKVDWHRRDRETVKTLIMLRDRCELRLNGPRCSRNWYLNQLNHKARIEKHLKLLPLCSLFFDRYCENIFEYQVRRITYTAVEMIRDGHKLKRWRVLRRSGLSEERLTIPAGRFIKEVLGI